MKKSLLLLSVLCLCLNAVELIRNGSFEELDAEGNPLYWRPNNTGERKNVKHSVLTSEANTGKNCVSISTDDTAISTGDFVAWIQDIDGKLIGENYEPGKHMALEFDFTGDAPGTVLRAYVEGRAMGKAFNAIGGGKSVYVGWTHYSLNFTMPEQKPDMMYVVIQLLSVGEIKIDNVSITDAPQAIQEAAAPAVVSKEPTTLDLRFPEFPVQSTFVIGETPRVLKVDCGMTAHKISELKCEIREFDSNAVVAATHIESFANHCAGAWKFPELAPGMYRFCCSAVYKGEKCEENIAFRMATKEEIATWKVRFRPDRIMLKDGKPYFPIIVCPGHYDEESLKAYQLAGFNGFTRHSNANINAEEAAEYFPSFAKYSLDVYDWANFMDRAKQPDAAMKKHLQVVASNAVKYPNFLGWMNDENAWRGISAEEERKCFQYFMRYMPGFICWNNQAPRGTLPFLRRYCRHTDVTGADVYPIPAECAHSEMPRQTLADVGDYTDDFLDITDCTKPVWMILQAWSWANTLEGSEDRPVPSINELRFMLYNVLTHGATGIAWFQQPFMDPQSPVMPRLSQVNHEFHAIESFILEGSTTSKASISGDTADLKLMERTLGNDTLLILVNERTSARKATLNTACGKLTDTLGTKEALDDGTSEIAMAPFEVIIYCTRKITFDAPQVFPAIHTEKDSSVTPLPEAIAKNIKGKTIWRAKWFWNEELNANATYSECTARHNFNVDGEVKSAWLMVGADNSVMVSINGTEIAFHEGWTPLHELDIAKYLKTGKNVLELHIANFSNVGAAIFEGEVHTDKGTVVLLPSEDDTEISTPDGKGMRKPLLFMQPPDGPWGDIYRK